MALSAGSPNPEETVDLSSKGDGSVGDGVPPRAMSWGRSQRDNGHLLLIVRSDRTAVVARIKAPGGNANSNSSSGGSSSSVSDFQVDDVADGEDSFTAGCWLWKGRGRLAMGRVTGEVEVYQESGNGLQDALGATECPSILELPGQAEVRMAVARGGGLGRVVREREEEFDKGWNSCVLACVSVFEGACVACVCLCVSAYVGGFICVCEMVLRWLVNPQRWPSRWCKQGYLHQPSTQLPLLTWCFRGPLGR